MLNINLFPKGRRHQYAILSFVILLAAQLNFGAGACTTPEVLQAALQAETLLDKYDFDGNGHDQLSKKSPDVQLANDLATYLDDYNNGMYCGDGID